MVSDNLIAPTTGTIPLTNESREPMSNEWTAPATNESIAPRQMSNANSRQPVTPRPAAEHGDQVGILSSRGHEVHHRPSARFSNQHRQPPQSVEQHIHHTVALQAFAQSFTLDERHLVSQKNVQVFDADITVGSRPSVRDNSASQHNEEERQAVDTINPITHHTVRELESLISIGLRKQWRLICGPSG
jgi:hypothetical protein